MAGGVSRRLPGVFEERHRGLQRRVERQFVFSSGGAQVAFPPLDDRPVRLPHLVRGIVHTPHGAFAINRGLADLPEEIGDSLGWPRVEEAQTSAVPPRETTTDGQPSADPVAASG